MDEKEHQQLEAPQPVQEETVDNALRLAARDLQLFTDAVRKGKQLGLLLSFTRRASTSMTDSSNTTDTSRGPAQTFSKEQSAHIYRRETRLLLGDSRIVVHTPEISATSTEEKANVKDAAERDIGGGTVPKETSGRECSRATAIVKQDLETTAIHAQIHPVSTSPHISTHGRTDFLASRFQEGAALSATARSLGLTEAGSFIAKALSADRSASTVNTYRTEITKFQVWKESISMRTITLPKARNLYLSKCASEGRQKALPLVVSTLNYFCGHLTGVDRDIQASILAAEKRVTATVQHRSKIDQSSMRKLILQGTSSADPKMTQAATLAMLQFKAFLKISEARNLHRNDLTIWQDGKGSWNFGKEDEHLRNGQMKLDRKREEPESHILPSKKKAEVLYCVARTIVDHEDVDRQIEAIIEHYRRLGNITLMDELMAYLIHFNTARSECIYKMNYGSRFETEHDIDEPGTSGGTIESNGLRMITVPRDDGNVEELWPRDFKREQHYQLQPDPWA
ncbi:hypothetical protein ANCCEY_10956 [Ancylostoma ceylanicum]|uniref:Uncharacterized protein n=1 Tax=Ancylostoma ceylanicum TaxID=53326 RepID=A0A0D6LQN5_9BILA|nr:hypothetical protein ANCCEY_10956 [Ancylostoma ceylanicum]